MAVIIDHLDLDQVANSGQCFRMEKLDNDGSKSRYRVFSGCDVVEVRDLDNNVFTFSCTNREYERVWERYFDVATDYEYMDSLIPEDDGFLRRAMEYGKGIRILRQDLWEASVSFIVSQNNNIPRIKGILKKICMENGGGFPNPSELVRILDRVNVGLGYRESYLRDLVNTFRTTDMANLYNLPYSDQLRELMKLKGVGGKVANCICLYGLHTLDACPIDVWMSRIIEENYGGITPDWMVSEYAGYYQQLCFYYKRNNR